MTSSEIPDTKATTDSRLLLLFPSDNIFVVTSPIGCGEEVAIRDVDVTATKPIDLGHKVAACPIAAGNKIIKYGAPIGSATRDIEAGEHVHTHNMKSDYIQTYTFDEGHRFDKNI